jgi:putative aminopeptidase FrvX
MHSTVQLCSIEDIESTIELLVAFLENAHKADLG